MRHLVFAIVALFLASCATSMTPSQVMEKLPKATKSELYSLARAKEALASNKCKLLSDERRYAAPIGLSVDQDLRNGARGIDEWVGLDGGNAFRLDNFEWISIGDEYGSTQLVIYFSTMFC